MASASKCALHSSEFAFAWRGKGVFFFLFFFLGFPNGVDLVERDLCVREYIIILLNCSFTRKCLSSV